MDPIIGKVAAIINPRGVMINRGSIDGVKKGMFFSVRLIVPEIVDPEDPSRVLQGVFFEKGRIEIASVFGPMSFGQIIPIPGSQGIGADQLKEMLVRYPDVRGRGLLSENDWAIGVGDWVAEIPIARASLLKPGPAGG